MKTDRALARGSASALLTVALVHFAGGLSAQTLWGLEAGPVPGPHVVHGFARPSDPSTCGYPDASPLRTFTATTTSPCASLAGLDGDVAVDIVNDALYVGLNGTIARYTLDGVFVDSFDVPIAVHGMGVNPNTGRIWITDGGVYGAVDPPTVPGCQQTLPFAVWGFVPTGATWFAGFLTDIDFDPFTRSLVGCSTSGRVGSWMHGTTPIRGPFPFYQASPGGCGLDAGLTGLALDHARPGTGIAWVTDGINIAYLQPGGAPASPRPYAPTACMPVPGGMLTGLAYSALPVPYGQGADTVGLAPPEIGSLSQALIRSDHFGFTLSGSVPGGVAALLVGINGPACPPRSGLGLVQPPLYLLGLAPVDANGATSLVTPVPGITPIGLTAWAQWVVRTPVPSVQASNAMEVTFATR